MSDKINPIDIPNIADLFSTKPLDKKIKEKEVEKEKNDLHPPPPMFNLSLGTSEPKTEDVLNLSLGSEIKEESPNTMILSLDSLDNSINMEPPPAPIKLESTPSISLETIPINTSVSHLGDFSTLLKETAGILLICGSYKINFKIILEKHLSEETKNRVLIIDNPLTYSKEHIAFMGCSGRLILVIIEAISKESAKDGLNLLLSKESEETKRIFLKYLKHSVFLYADQHGDLLKFEL